MAGQREISVGVKFTGNAKGFEKATREASAANERLKSKINANTKGITNAFKEIGVAMAAAFGVREVVNFTKESVKLAATAEGIKTAFDSLNDSGLLSNLQTATKGTVDNMTLMQKAVQANNFKIPLEQLATYFDFATKRATQTGESVDYLVNSLITGLGRKSVLVMDNLGISAVELQNEVNKVGDFATAAGNIMQRELTAMGDVADTAGTKLQQLTASTNNLKVAWGEFIANNKVYKGVIDSLLGSITIINEKGVTFWQKLLLGMGNYAAFAKSIAKSESEIMTIQAGKKIQKFEEEIETLTTLNEKLAGYREELGLINIKDTDSLNILNAKIKALQDYIKRLSSVKEATDKLQGNNKLPGISSGFVTPGLASMSPNTKANNEEQLKLNRAIELNDVLEEQKGIILSVSDTFSNYFTNIDQGFQETIQGVIRGIEQLVVKLLAEAAILAILTTITGGQVNAATFKPLFNGIPKIGGGTGGGSLGPATIQIEGITKGDAIYWSNKRYGQSLASNT